MEAARSVPFLLTEKLFSLMSNLYEKNLKEELYLCKKNMGYSMSELYNMPIMERKSYISIHNKITREYNEKLKRGG